MLRKLFNHIQKNETRSLPTPYTKINLILIIDFKTPKQNKKKLLEENIGGDLNIGLCDDFFKSNIKSKSNRTKMSGPTSS